MTEAVTFQVVRDEVVANPRRGVRASPVRSTRAGVGSQHSGNRELPGLIISGTIGKSDGRE
jgi:hypothetical protein